MRRPVVPRRMAPGLAVLGLSTLVFGLGACAKLLGLDDPRAKEFSHRAHALEGIACTQCHADVGDAGERGPLHLPSSKSCTSCHENPHDERPCLTCHGDESTHRRALANRRHIRFRHDQHLEEMPGACVRCHRGVETERTSLEAPMASCLSCHEHKDEFRIRDCDACHEDLRQELPLPETHVVHEGDFFRRHGVQAASAGDLCSSCHTERSCAKCHGVTVPAVPSRMRFDDTMRQTMHRAGFFARHREEAHANPGLCTTCHSERFCSDCHLERGIHALAEGRRNPHPPGWVGPLGSDNAHGPAARRDPTSCASCHGGAGEQLCVGCHRVGGIGGSPHPPGWSTRRHRSEMPCRLCHVPVP